MSALIERQIVEGIYLPARDEHFADRLRGSELVDDRGTYQLAKLRAALEVAPERRGLAVDVGAHVGLWTRVLAADFERVLAIEPMPEHVECFLLNTRGLPNVTLRETAIADFSGRLALRRAPNIATARVCEDGEDADIFVPAHRLDDLMLEGVDFLKIDCEGFEQFVVRGGERTIRRDRPVVVIEQKKRSTRYGVDRLAGAALLQVWGAELVWDKAGDYCLAWR